MKLKSQMRVFVEWVGLQTKPPWTLVQINLGMDLEAQGRNPMVNSLTVTER